MNEMSAIEIARRLAELGRQEEACQAYTLVIREARGTAPDLELEAAVYIFQNGGSYKVAYDSFRSLYNQGHFKEDLLSIMTQAFYEPNMKMLQTRYEKNCKLLQKYPYLFRKAFPAFEALPIRFFPYDDHSYAPFHVQEERFGDYINFNHPVVSRNFFHDLDKPILASDVFSMYELEYLNDNVRKSENVGKENHIYLHYTDWGTFCAHLQCLNLRRLLADKKIVFLIGEELGQYPIDFKERFGIDYSQYPVKPIGIREVHRLIWHTQLAAHNGGDFFNEIFDNHPNLISFPSIMMDSIERSVENIKRAMGNGSKVTGFDPGDGDLEKTERLVEQLRQLRDRTDKDIFVTLFLCKADLRPLDPASRIAPAVFFQPHFHNIYYKLAANKQGRCQLHSDQYQVLQEAPLFKGFKYIKTFTPMRRITNSTAATVRFMNWQMHLLKVKGEKLLVMGDSLVDRTLNRSYMVDWQDRLFKDSVLVRFEDGKLNPKATFTALAAFLDLPYTESMTYCSFNGKRYEGKEGSGVGVDAGSVYRTYDEYLGPAERYFLEYFTRDAYDYYGYDFHYYDGAPVDMDRVRELVRNMTVLNGHISRSTQEYLADQDEIKTQDGKVLTGQAREDFLKEAFEERMKEIDDKRLQSAMILLRGLRFINKNGQPLNMMPLLRLDPALLERPLYH